MNAFCASENFNAFIVFRSSQPRDVTAENSNYERSSFQGSEHTPHLLRCAQKCDNTENSRSIRVSGSTTFSGLEESGSA